MAMRPIIPANPPMRGRGLTLIETVVAMGVLVVLATVAVPYFGASRHAARAGHAKAVLLSSLLASTSRSAATGRRVVLCSSRDGTTCNGGQAWHLGWIAFADLDGDKVLDADEYKFVDQPALGGDVRLLSTPGRTRLVFQPNGGNVGSNATFTLCDGRGAKSSVTLVLSNAGRLREGRPSKKAALQCEASP